MAVTRVQAAGHIVTTGTAMTLASGDGWATPTAGNLLILVTNGPNFVSTGPAGWTAGPSIANDNGAYLWWKVAAGTESTITVTQNGSGVGTIFCAEYAASGLLGTPFDVQNFANTTGSAGTTTAAAAITTTGANGDLVFAVAALCRDVAGTTVPTALTWSNSYSAIFNHATAGTNGANDVSTWYAELQQSAPGATSTVATWTTGSWNARQALIISFKLAAAPTAPPPGILYIGPTRG
jgi:hypothetical protein